MSVQIPLRTRPVSVGHWRAFEAVARHLTIRAAAEELSLTQSLEEEVGLPLFLRHTRAVELTGAGAQLLQVVSASLSRIDSAVRLVRRTAGRKTVAISTWASFASMWLISRMEAFQSEHPEIDIRIDATDAVVDLETTDVDLALRYAVPGAPWNTQAQRLFGEQLTVVASPWLLKSTPSIQKPKDLLNFTLIEAGDTHRTQNLEWLSWQRWFEAQKLQTFEPKRWLYFNYAHQIVQAALTGQGIALARMPLVADSLASGDLVEVLPQARLDSPMAYWLLAAPRSAQRPEIKAFCAWLQAQAKTTRQAIGEVPDPDLSDDLDGSN